MWYMPSHRRPDRLRELLAAPGGWPHEVKVLVNADDPELQRYIQVIDGLIHDHQAALAIGAPGIFIPWRLCLITPESRCADAHRAITMVWPDEPFYGLLCDDHWPVTPGWHEAMEQASGCHYISTPAGEQLFPKIRNAVGFGGDLVRAMGSLVPAAVKHNYEDNLWDQVADDFQLLRPLPDFIVEHRHWIRGEAVKDATYRRGSADIDNDGMIFAQWLGSADRLAMGERIAKMLGLTITTFDPKTIRLAIGVSIQDSAVDAAYHRSLNQTMVHLAKCGISHSVHESIGGSHIGKARERALWECTQREPTHIAFIDADMGWQPSQLTRLIAADHDFSCIVGVRKRDELSLCANFYPQQEFHERTKFLKIKDVGMAFVVLKIDVIHRLCAAHPELEYNAGSSREWALFLDMIDENRERLSEDFSFCNRYRGIGGEIWCDADQSIIHAGRKEYTGKVADLFEIEKPQQLQAAE